MILWKFITSLGLFVLCSFRFALLLILIMKSTKPWYNSKQWLEGAEELRFANIDVNGDVIKYEIYVQSLAATFRSINHQNVRYVYFTDRKLKQSDEAKDY